MSTRGIAMTLGLILGLGFQALAQAPRPVDTVQLANLERRMTTADVRATLGPPAEVRPAEPLLVRTGPGRYRQVQREVWVYPGTYGVPGAWLQFSGGTLMRWGRVDK